MSTLHEAARAVLKRWDSPHGDWSQEGSTAELMAALRAALAASEAQTSAPALEWAEAPERTQWGGGMMEALVALGKDDTLRLYAEAEALHLVGAALHAVAVAEERRRLIDEFRKRHKQNQMHHNFYACLARQMEDGLL